MKLSFRGQESDIVKTEVNGIELFLYYAKRTGIYVLTVKGKRSRNYLESELPKKWKKIYQEMVEFYLNEGEDLNVI